MNDAMVVGGFERLGNLSGDWQRFVEWNSALRDPIGKGRPLDELEHQRLYAAAVFKSVNCGNVRVIQRGQYLRFAFEAGEPIRIEREQFRQDLQRDVAIQPRIPGTIDLAHASGAEGGEDFIRPETCACGQGHGNGRRIIR